MKLFGKIALITGAGSGIGRATAILFAKEGAKVVVADYDSSGGNETVKIIHHSGGDAIFVEGDVSRLTDSVNIVRVTIEKYGKLDILFNNAGIGVFGNVTDTTEGEWNRIIGINLKGVFLVSKYAIPEMLKNGRGVVINMAGTAGLVGWKNLSAYCASKGGVISLTKAMALDYAPNIRVNCVCPGTISTPMSEKGFATLKDPDGMRKNFIKLHPMGRLGTPEDVANAVLYLASEESSFMTGSALVVDGGSTIY